MVGVAISSGHGKYIRGARGNPVPPQLDEVDEARRVVNRVAELWKEADIPVKVFHDNTSTSQSQNLNAIVNWHNSQSRDYDVSVHFNAYQNTSKPMGVEVLYVTQQKLAADTSLAIAQAGAFINRGAKKRTDLAFLNGTNKPSILIETCFCDSTADSDLYHQHFESICQRIAEVVGQVSIGEGPPDIEEPPPTEPPPTEEVSRVDINIKATGPVIISINGQDFAFNVSGPEEPSEPAFPPNQQNITCTVFGGKSDPNNSAYAPYDTITDKEISCALPYKFPDPRPQVLVNLAGSEVSVVCQIRDVGPWNIDDPYWQTGTRPQAESGTDMSGRETNGAGIDLTPAAAKKLGFSGKASVNWRFISENEEIA